MINPAKLLKLKGAWDIFSANHPKFPKFIEAISKNGVKEGTIIEINVTNTEGQTISTNLKITQSDTELFKTISELMRN